MALDSYRWIFLCFALIYVTFVISQPDECTCACTALHPDDRKALLSLKSAITSDPAGIFKSWNTSYSSCKDGWTGVYCDSNGRVTCIERKSFYSYTDIKGTIHPDVGKLSKLIYINVSPNTLSGPIPTSFGNLINLKYLWLSFNQFSGKIPASLGNLKNLETLQLRNNFLSGDVTPLNSVCSKAVNELSSNCFSTDSNSTTCNITPQRAQNECLITTPPPTKSPPRRSPPKKSPPKRSPPKKSPPKRSPPKKSPPKRSPPMKSPPKRSPPKKSPPKRSPPKKSPPKRSPPKKSP